MFFFDVNCLVKAGMDEANEAYERGDYASAYRQLLPLAEQGHAEAQYNLGIMYSEGQGVPQKDAEALNWYREAAEQDFVPGATVTNRLHRRAVQPWQEKQGANRRKHRNDTH